MSKAKKFLSEKYILIILAFVLILLLGRVAYIYWENNNALDPSQASTQSEHLSSKNSNCNIKDNANKKVLKYDEYNSYISGHDFLSIEKSKGANVTVPLYNKNITVYVPTGYSLNSFASLECGDSYYSESKCEDHNLVLREYITIESPKFFVLADERKVSEGEHQSLSLYFETSNYGTMWGFGRYVKDMPISNLDYDDYLIHSVTVGDTRLPVLGVYYINIGMDHVVTNDKYLYSSELGYVGSIDIPSWKKHERLCYLDNSDDYPIFEKYIGNLADGDSYVCKTFLIHSDNGPDIDTLLDIANSIKVDLRK